MRPDVGSVLQALLEANVQFVVVGDPAADGPLRLVVSQHPTNLDAMGRVLDRLGSSLRVAPPADDAQVRRITDPLGIVAVTTRAGDVDLVMGAPGGAVYAETLASSHVQVIGGHRVRWAPAPASVALVERGTGATVSRRMLRLAEGLSRVMEHGDHDGGPGTGDLEGEPR